MDRPPPLEGFEARVMEEIWRQGSVTVRDVMTAINAVEPVDRAYTTYMTVLVRLHNKGLLTRELEGKANHYAPAVRARGVRGLAGRGRRAGDRRTPRRSSR